MTTATHLERFITSKIPAQKTFMESIHEEILYSGAFGAGKSIVGCEKGLFFSLYYPGNRGLICRKTFSSLRYTTMKTWFRYVMPPEYQKSWNQETHELVLTNGSEVLFLGLDDHNKMGSAEFGWIFIDEATETSEDDYTMLLGRLRLNTVPFRQIFLATNPGDENHYLYKRFFRDQDPRRLVVQSNTLENPFLPDDYVRRLEGFTGRYRQRYVEGKWVGFEGLVYEVWDADQHHIDHFPIPADWPIFRVIDFGYTNPFVCQWWAEAKKDADGNYPIINGVERSGYFLFKEIYMSSRTIPEHAWTIKDHSQGMRVVDTFSDHDAGDRMLLEREGIPTTPAIKDIIPGIQVVHAAIASGRIHIFKDSLIEPDEILDGKNLPISTAMEFPSFRFVDRKEGKNTKEVPRDLNDHGMDCIRYLLATKEGIESINQVAMYGEKYGFTNQVRSMSVGGSQDNKFHQFRPSSGYGKFSVGGGRW